MQIIAKFHRILFVLLLVTASNTLVFVYKIGKVTNCAAIQQLGSLDTLISNETRVITNCHRTRCVLLLMKSYKPPIYFFQYEETVPSFSN